MKIKNILLATSLLAIAGMVSDGYAFQRYSSVSKPGITQAAPEIGRGAEHAAPEKVESARQLATPGIGKSVSRYVSLEERRKKAEAELLEEQKREKAAQEAEMEKSYMLRTHSPVKGRALPESMLTEGSFSIAKALEMDKQRLKAVEDLDQLSKDYDSLTAEDKKLMVQAIKAEAKVKRLSKELETLSPKIAELNGRISDLSKENKDLADKADQQDADLNTMVAEAAKKDVLITRLNEEKEQAKVAADEAKDDAARMLRAMKSQTENLRGALEVVARTLKGTAPLDGAEQAEIQAYNVKVAQVDTALKDVFDLLRGEGHGAHAGENGVAPAPDAGAPVPGAHEGGDGVVPNAGAGNDAHDAAPDAGVGNDGNA